MSLNNLKNYQIITLLNPIEKESGPEYKKVFQLPAKYVPQAIEISHTLTDALETVTINEKQTIRFNFQKAIDIVNSHSEMAIVGYKEQTISQNNSEVKAMVNKIIELLKTTLQVFLDPTIIQQWNETITSAFTNLSSEEDSAWIFWQKEEQHKTEYEYAFLFAIVNENTGSVMLALPIALTITVNVSKEQVLFITLRDKHDYSVTVESLQIVEALKN